MFEKSKKVAEAPFHLQFDIFMVQRRFHPIKQIWFQAIDLLLTFLKFSHTKQW